MRRSSHLRQSAAPAEPAELPAGYKVRLDPTVRLLAGGRGMLGGRPMRLVRLSDAGSARLTALLDRGVRDRTDSRLARRLLDAGLVQPSPRPWAPEGRLAVVVPVRDRPADLDRCLAALAMGHRVLVVDDGSADPAATGEVGRAHDARVLRRPSSGGPAAARNHGLAALVADTALSGTTEFVAFVDSDTVVSHGWLDVLLGHFRDPAVGAVAPRVRPAPTVPDVAGGDPAPATPGRLLARFIESRSPLDMGARAAPVQPGGRVGYLPTAALVVRRAALDQIGAEPFDEALRYGEDVDLVWRLHDRGWRVRYEPAVVVGHAEPVSWRGWLRRRFAYGTSAGPLAQRHPGRLAPARLAPWPAVVVCLVVGRHPLAAGTVATAFTGRLSRRLADRGVPASEVARLAALGVADTARSLSRIGTQLALPAAVVAVVLNRRHRRGLLALLPADPLAAWWQRRPAVDPLRWLLLSWLDDAAYGAGVWAGAVRHRQRGPLLPRVTTSTP